MANNHDQFDGFLDEIRITEGKLSSLRTSRDANRDRIRKHWKDVMKRKEPEFDAQGSYDMRTGVVPIEGDFDIDDGVYLRCIGTDPNEWPATSTVQGWLVDAVEGATKGDPIKKKSCVRVPYAGGYHVDLPAYGRDESGKTHLFEKGVEPASFVESNPTEFTDWFKEKNSKKPTTRDLVRFFKAWRDYRKGATLKLKSISINILIAKLLVEDSRYDSSVAKTARACATFLENGGEIQKPVSPRESLTASWSSEDRTAVVKALTGLAEAGDDAIDDHSVRGGALIWQKEFGSRFPVPDEDASETTSGALRSPAPAIITSGTFA